MRRLWAAAIAGVSYIGVSCGSLAADLQGYKPLPAPAPYSWTGFYVGGNAGFGWANQDTSLTVLGTTFANSVRPRGFIGGGQVGYNWQTGRLVLGLEADLQGSGQTQSSTVTGVLLGIPATETISEKIDLFGTVRGRLGYAFDRWMPYATGGWVYSRGSASLTFTAAGVTTTGAASANSTDGWTIGSGLEAAIGERWSAKVEYLYIDFGAQTGGFAAVPGVAFTASHMTDNVARAGLNYRF